MTDLRGTIVMKVLIALLLLSTIPLSAQEEPQPLRKLPLGDVLLSLPSTQIQPHGLWELRFSHRFRQSIDQGNFSDRIHSLFGLDGSADVVLGLSWSARPNLQFSMTRSNTNDTIETAAKWVVLQKTGSFPLQAALRGGVDYRTEKDLDDRTSLFLQAIVSHQFGRRAEIFIHPTFVTDAGRQVSLDGTSALFSEVFNMPVSFAYMVRPTVSVIVELTPANREIEEADLGWAVGVKRAIGGHWFELLLTNNQSTLTDQFATSTFQGAPFDNGDIHLGFNLSRRFGRRR